MAWNDPAVEKLWLYNLHYFDGLHAPDAEVQSALHQAWVQRWLQDNPPAQGNGWEPYPLSLRIVNWIKWLLAGQAATPEVLHSLAIQVRYLRRRLEHHLLGNHLFENAKALVFAGSFFAGEEAERWLADGRRLMQAQLREQLLPDGGHFERSPMYHALLLEGLLDLHNLARATGAGDEAPWAAPAVRMLDWLRRLCHPDGGIAFFNDAAFGIAPDLSALEAYAARLALATGGAPEAGAWLGETGYARLACGAALVLADVAPVGPDYLPGHAHADTLSFECSIHGRRVLVNGGTSTYAVGSERQRQRGTAAHNTVCIDGRDSSEVWAGFRVARRARVHVDRFEAGPPAVLQATHDGYRRLPGGPVHRRRWTLREDGLEIQDEVLGTGEHLIESFLHLHPDLALSAETPQGYAVLDDKGRALATIEFDPRLSWRAEPGTWHPGFGQTVAATFMHGYWKVALPVQWRTLVRWTD